MRPKVFESAAEKQRAYRERKKGNVTVVESTVTEFPTTVTLKQEIVTPTVTVHAKDMQKCPEGVEPREWRYACERAERARKYAKAMPEHIRPSDVRFQDPMWQWENEAKGRMVKDLGLSISR